jgi:hypothetical protein
LQSLAVLLAYGLRWARARELGVRRRALVTPHTTKNTPADSTLIREFHATSVISTSFP